ncbi:hypothetical protein HBI23_258230 [Parastagonospora nodorum]|nr:hypothetical protein HBI23_258230 [Parastagonospora nodorum]KAH5622329.1 hypothetical protein HBI51_246930 [Parastagonospora nodorum]KAH5982823.1 hypothetical protein HBI84_250240 [Parastagonospora nodorum]KAH6133469.1 hypothetical protein HBI68_254200 [Parastagonospora nodorum]KAH6380584.1 hypothetical protein HBI08_235150 [Parastagonospora nodorum]
MSPRIYAKIDKAKGRGCLAQYFAWISWIYTKTGVSNSGPASDQLEDRKDLSILPQPPANDELPTTLAKYTRRREDDGKFKCVCEETFQTVESVTVHTERCEGKAKKDKSRPRPDSPTLGDTDERHSSE